LTRTERQQELAILEQLKDTSLSEQYRGRLRADLETLHESIKTRKNAKANGKPPDELPPQREDFSSDKEWEVACELHRLTLTAKAAEKKLDSDRTSLSGRLTAERELKRVAKRRAELLPPREEVPAPVQSVTEENRQNERLAQLCNPKKSTEDLFNSRNLAAYMYGPHSAECKGVEVELENRGVDWRFWLLSENDSSIMHLYPNRPAAERLIVEVRRNRPQTQPTVTTNPSPRAAPPPTPAQKESRQHWQNQHGSWEDKKTAVTSLPAVQASREVAYQISDGCMFYPDGTKADEPLPLGTRVFPVSAPPSYVRGSGDVAGWQINVIVGCWVPAGSQRA
jgi:hypothetical protein